METNGVNFSGTSGVYPQGAVASTDLSTKTAEQDVSFEERYYKPDEDPTAYLENRLIIQIWKKRHPVLK